MNVGLIDVDMKNTGKKDFPYTDTDETVCIS